ncbi:gp53-like domain-containing protein [Pseudomonas frederiksbergensis]|uniref:gp53-like domain-containing protein n=1 Tax=Pseudomonas frederiksbergensis TaxID=104087 RepID=UPI000F4A6626|nr:phage tail protein [Pseudomonas frederiksbergensis]RON56984.1 phage tail protein [Pseudomonas frederiksbergensis]
MDFPKSVPSAGLVNGKFADENPLSGTPGSLIPATWGNGVTQEILSVVQAAGFTPDEASQTQLLAALRSPALFLTAPQFDAGRSAATSEFVQRALGNYASSRGISAVTQLTVADVGTAIGLGGNVAYTVTLPDATTVPNGATISLHCRNSAAVTIASKTGSQVSPQGAFLSSMVMNSGESAHFVRESGIWAVYGTASLKYAASFSGVVGTPGYQKYPSGNIDQWGYGTTDANGEIYVTFLTAFPTAFSSIVANHVGGEGAAVILYAGSATKTGCRLRVRDMNGGSAGGWGVYYFAKGY